MISPELINTPRFYTAIAEWAGCLIYVLLLKKRFSGIRLAGALGGAFLLISAFQHFLGMLPLYLWIPGMLTAITLMFLCIYALCDISIIDGWFCCVRAFVLAEFAASFYWQIYVWWVVKTTKQNYILSILLMILCYASLYTSYYLLDKKHIPTDEKLNVGLKEMIGAASIALGSFSMSNISFVMPNTPFSSATSSILYIRTLVDLGGLVMLFAQQDKREEIRMRTENQAMNIVLQRQYEQYRLAQDNMELIRRELHDLKHYLIAARSENNLEKQQQYFLEMENAILMQESLFHTGNHVLDVVVSTKSLYCTQRNINFSCMADGKLIDFMHVKDICSIFGNALDNAIESVELITNSDKRLISLSMYKKNQLLMIQFENYYENNLVIKDSLPLTTKPNKLYHGYGLKSIQLAAQKYDGTITIHGKDKWFTLQILIPLRNTAS